MKKLLILFIPLVLFFGCEEDNNNDNSTTGYNCVDNDCFSEEGGQYATLDDCLSVCEQNNDIKCNNNNSLLFDAKNTFSLTDVLIADDGCYEIFDNGMDEIHCDIILVLIGDGATFDKSYDWVIEKTGLIMRFILHYDDDDLSLYNTIAGTYMLANEYGVNNTMSSCDYDLSLSDTNYWQDIISGGLTISSLGEMNYEISFYLVDINGNVLSGCYSGEPVFKLK